LTLTVVVPPNFILHAATQSCAKYAVGEAWSEWLRHAYDRANIELNPRYGKLDPVTGQIVAVSNDTSSEGSADSGSG
jgi:hypothetical protein